MLGTWGVGRMRRIRCTAGCLGPWACSVLVCLIFLHHRMAGIVKAIQKKILGPGVGQPSGGEKVDPDPSSLRGLAFHREAAERNGRRRAVFKAAGDQLKALGDHQSAVAAYGFHDALAASQQVAQTIVREVEAGLSDGVCPDHGLAECLCLHPAGGEVARRYRSYAVWAWRHRLSELYLAGEKERYTLLNGPDPVPEFQLPACPIAQGQKKPTVLEEPLDSKEKDSDKEPESKG